MSKTKEGVYTIAGHHFMVIDDEFIEDLIDMGYENSIDLEDLIEEYDLWIKDLT